MSFWRSAGLAALTALLWPLAAGAVIVDRVAAVVNDDVIALSDVYELGSDYIEQAAAADGPQAAGPARRAAELEVLDSLVMRRLISQEIDRLMLDVEDVELERTIDDISRRNGLDRDALRNEVERSGMSWTQYRSELRENLRQAKFTQAVIQPRITVNDDELLDAYRRIVASSARSEVSDLGAMFFALKAADSQAADPDAAARADAMARAQAAAARIAAGEAFGAVAAEVDDGPYGAAGGKMGSYRQGELVGELDRPAFALEVGAVSEPIVTAQGVFLLTVFDRKAEAAQSFEDVREQLFEQVYASRIEDETSQWYQQARRRAAVVVKLESTDAP